MALNSTVLEEKEELEKEMYRIAKKSKAKRKLITTLILIVLIIAAVVAAWFFGQQQAKKKAALLEINSISTIDLDVLNSEIKNIGELSSVEYLFTTASTFSNSKQIKSWNIPLTEKSFILRWSGVIKAGVKLDDLELEINDDFKKIIITVPSAEILSYYVDSDSVEVLNEKNNIFNKLTIEDKIDFDKKVEDETIQHAIEDGILEKAQINTKDILSRLINFLPGGSNYTIEFTVK